MAEARDFRTRRSRSHLSRRLRDAASPGGIASLGLDVAGKPATAGTGIGSGSQRSVSSHNSPGRHPMEKLRSPVAVRVLRNRTVVARTAECDNLLMPFCSNCGASLPRGARFCPGCATPVAEGPPSEERKVATVVFADLVGSTALADSQDAERSRALLNRFYEGMASEIAHAGGTIEKFIGDAVVAVFGAP